MPVILHKDLPARNILESENIVALKSSTRDQKKLRILILNLMPTKLETEIQLLRLLGNSPLLIEPILLYTDTHESKHVSKEHLSNFYKTFTEIKNQSFDGMIITGAPVEHLDFTEVDYWEELQQIMRYSTTNVKSTFHICWGAQAGLYYHYGIPKYSLTTKLFGIFPHTVVHGQIPLLKGFDDRFFVPHSRYTEVRCEDILKVSELEVLSESAHAGVYLVIAKNGSQIFATGHSEYDPLTLKKEYDRDLARGINIEIPYNYFKDDNPQNSPIVSWRSHAYLLFLNWLHYYVN